MLQVDGVYTTEITNAPTPRSRILPDKLAVNKLPAIYRIQRFIAVFTRTRDLSLS